jgi:tetratricopeptide (TPR) repeat protein
MRLWLLTLLAASLLPAADEQQLALELRAQSDFDRVQLAVAPSLAETGLCIQSQAALLAVAPIAEQPLVHYRKGYCSLVGNDFAAAAQEFDKATDAWRTASSHGKDLARPVPAPLLALSGIARLKAGGDEDALDVAEKNINAALANPSCTSALMTAVSCEAELATAREWLGWLDVRRDNLTAAAREFGQTANTAWQHWVAGRQAFANRSFTQAAAAGRRAIEEWDQQRNLAAPSLNDRLRPQPDLGQALTDLGGAQLLAGETPAAIATLDRAVKTPPAEARAYYFRARAKELSGQQEAAIADYALASRTAFAGTQDLASGEAHLYRGIAYYRRKQFQRAEDEFASALNFNVPAPLRPDAEAWRYLAAVATGSCQGSRESLASAMGRVSPYFPRTEAATAMAACPMSSMTALRPN